MVLCIIGSEVTQQNIRSCLLFQNNSFDISWSIFQRKLGVIFAPLRSWQLDRETVFGEGIVIALKWIPHLGDKKTRDRKGGSWISPPLLPRKKMKVNGEHFCNYGAGLKVCKYQSQVQTSSEVSSWTPSVGNTSSSIHHFSFSQLCDKRIYCDI